MTVRRPPAILSRRICEIRGPGEFGQSQRQGKKVAIATARVFERCGFTPAASYRKPGAPERARVPPEVTTVGRDSL